MAILHAKLLSNDKPARSITSNELIKIELSHKNRLAVTILAHNIDGKPFIEYWTANGYGTIDIVTEQKPKAICLHNWHATHDTPKGYVYTKCSNCGLIKED